MIQNIENKKYIKSYLFSFFESKLLIPKNDKMIKNIFKFIPEYVPTKTNVNGK